MFDFPNAPSVGQVYAPAGGPSWQWDGTVWKSFQSNGETAINRIFVPGASGAATNYTYSKPANLRYLEVEGVAAGGSAGPAIGTGASTWSYSSGGGGGAWGKKLFQAAALPASVAAVIGAPGAAKAVTGNGNDAADTTFGSLITLPGGRKGLQSANVAYTTYGTVSGSGFTAFPTGVDVGAPGESSNGITSSFSMGYPSVTGLSVFVGGAGGSPWGKNTASQFASGTLNSAVGTGYGQGSSPTVQAGSGAGIIASVAGSPGALLLTEYLAVAASGDQLLTPFVPYVPVITGLGTVTALTAYSRRVGDCLEVNAKWTSGTPTAAQAQFQLGYNGVSGNVVIDAKATPALFCGQAVRNVNLAGFYTPIAIPGRGYITFGVSTATTNPYNELTGSALQGVGEVFSIAIRVPIVGW